MTCKIWGDLPEGLFINLVSCLQQLLSFTLGGAWDNAKKYIEAGRDE